MTRNQVTRGYGLLEPFLAQQRAWMANRLIPPALRSGRILDIGCGTSPYFLAHTRFREKFAIDRHAAPPSASGIIWHTLDLNAAPHLPFADRFFSVVTLLAVIEHLDPDKLVSLFRDCHRVLHAGEVLSC